MRTTIKDIAAETDLSVTTVSLVLNNKADKIPQRTKDIVWEAAKLLNYRPNQLAVSLVKKRTKTIGLIISDVSNIFFSTLAKAVEDECHKNGWNLILCNTNDEHQRDLGYINVLADRGVDGILFGMSADTDLEKAQESCKLMTSLHTPFVMIDRFYESIDCCSVALDNKCGGYLATKHFLSLGHTRIACVTGPLHLEDSANRLMGYKRALEEAGIKYDLQIIYEGKYSMESGCDAVDYLHDKDFSAVFAFNDMTAYGVCNRLKKYNLTVPKHISVVGYDDIFFSKILEVPLTTVHQPIYEMGVEATRQLLNLIEYGKVDKQCITFMPTLVVRKSTEAKKEGKK